MITSFLITLLLGSHITFLSDILVTTMLETFKEYPYLLQGESDFTKNYIQEIADCKQGSLVIATVDEKFVGFLLGCPLMHKANDFNSLIQELRLLNQNPEEYYYYSDIIVTPPYRNKGIATQLCNYLPNKVASWGYKKICLLSVEPEEDHPLKPLHYNTMDLYWPKLGLKKTSLYGKDVWPTIINQQGEIEMKEHFLAFWVKDLN